MEAHFDKELTTAKRLSDLYKKQAEGRGAKATELEGVLQAGLLYALLHYEQTVRLRCEGHECKARQEAAAQRIMLTASSNSL